MKTIAIVVFAHALGIGALIGLGLWANELISRYTSNYSGLITVFSVAFTAYAFGINILYQRSRRVHLWVNRLRLHFVRTHSFWKPSFEFTLASEHLVDRSASLSKAVNAIESCHVGKTKRGPFTATTATICLDDMMTFLLRFDGAHLHVTLDRKLLMPSHLYDSYRQKLAKVANAIHHSLAPVEEARFCITVSFGDGAPNPYYGFFVNRVPAELLTHFDVSFRMNRNSACRIEAGKDFVNVDSTDVVDVFEALSQVVSLRAVPDGVAR